MLPQQVKQRVIMIETACAHCCFMLSVRWPKVFVYAVLAARKLEEEWQ
jgi:hypothetical protein